MMIPRSLALRAAGAASLVLAACGATVAGASITPEARAVVERFTQAIGGHDRWSKERTFHLRGTLEAFGLTGSVEAWAQQPDKSASVTSIGPFTIREGIDGTVAWRVDQNGKYTRLDGKDLEDARASAYFENDRWLAADQGGGKVEHAGVRSDSAGRFAVLEVTPPVGRARQLWFSERTGLLDRVITRRDQQIMTTHMLDYQVVEGRLRPKVNRLEIEGMPMNDARVTLDSMWTNRDIDPAVFAAVDRSTSDMRFLGGAGPVTIPFAYLGRHVWLKASVNGGPEEDFLLDTGASVTVIDSGYAARRGLKSEGQLGVTGAGASGGAAFSELDSLVVRAAGGQGVAIGHQKVAVLSLNTHLEPFFWKPIAGVLGYDFISRFVMTVDFDREVVVLHDPRAFTYRGAGAAIPLSMSGNIPVVHGKIDDAYEGEFRLDVGSSSTVDLHTPFVERHDLASQTGKKIDVVGGGFGGTFTSTLCRMKKMSIGPHSWTEPLVVLSQARTGGLASQDYAGNIGNHILERFVCTFDYERRVVYLEPGRRFGERDRFSRSGFQLAKFGDVYRAMQVLTGSPAAKAGLRVGDRVVAVDGRPITPEQAETLRAKFEDGTPGTRHTLEVERGGKRVKLRMTLAEML